MGNVFQSVRLIITIEDYLKFKCDQKQYKYNIINPKWFYYIGQQNIKFTEQGRMRRED